MLQKLFNGAKQGDLEGVEEALAEGANVDVGANPCGLIPLGFLVKHAHL